MQSRFNPKFKKTMTILHPGEHFACKDDRILATLLGSCVAVCLKDQETGVCGMNHFMLPGDFRSMDIFDNATGRYGMFAMELLLGEMIKLGSRRQKLTAKIFGGGHVLNFDSQGSSVSENNIKFVKAFLNMEGIKIIGQDLGGRQGRKVLFFTQNGDVYARKLAPTTEAKVTRAEKAYQSRLKREQPASDVTEF